MSVEYADRPAESYTVSVSQDGVISYDDPDAAASMPATGSSSASPPACDDSAYGDADFVMSGTWYWYLGDGVRPAGLTTAQTRDMLKEVGGWMSNGHTDCNISPGYSPYAVANSYQGISTYESDVTNAGGETTCGDGSFDGRDHESVIDFGNLDYYAPGGGIPVGLTCAWGTPIAFANNPVIEADIRFNTTDYDWFYTKPSYCSNKYDLRSVAMHEFGHVYGMGHVNEDTHGNLTMSRQAEQCSISARTLGKGDILSMREIYG